MFVVLLVVLLFGGRSIDELISSLDVGSWGGRAWRKVGRKRGLVIDGGVRYSPETKTVNARGEQMG